MIYKAVVFDMDGTIVDTERVWAQATCTLLEQKNIACTPELLHQIRTKIQGLDVVNSCRTIKEITGMEGTVGEICEVKKGIAHDYYAAGIRFMQGFIDFHKKLQALGIKTAIATNAVEKTIELTQEALNIRQFFGEHIYGLERVAGKGKPNPDVYLLAAEKIEMLPHLCVAIEDSAHGIVAAQKAGMFCIGLDPADNYAQVASADYIVKGFDGIDLDLLFGAQK